MKTQGRVNSNRLCCNNYDGRSVFFQLTVQVRASTVFFVLWISKSMDIISYQNSLSCLKLHWQRFKLIVTRWNLNWKFIKNRWHYKMLVNCKCQSNIYINKIEILITFLYIELRNQWNQNKSRSVCVWNRIHGILQVDLEVDVVYHNINNK